VSTTINTLRWTGTITGVIGAILLALNIEGSGYGFFFFLVSAAAYSYTSWVSGDLPMLVLQGTFFAIDLLGIWRWFLV
jgi:nicotinamide riboside transporter PnuC